jgi:Protein of unknown function (DUF2905)
MPIQEPMRELGKGLLLIGALFAAAGAFFLFGGRLPFRLGRLPGDIAYHGRNGGSFYFPVVTCILLSVLFSVVMWLVGHFRR